MSTPTNHDFRATPETDALSNFLEYKTWQLSYEEMREKARSLEQRLAAATSENERLTALCQAQLSKLNEIHDLRAKIAAATERLEKLNDGRTVTLPKSEAHAKAMITVGEFYLSHLSTRSDDQPGERG